MLKINLQRALRNYYYHHKTRKDNAYFSLFLAMYHFNNKPFSWIYPCYQHETIFLATHFLCPQLTKYCGLELAAFTSRHVACYWLPGAQTLAKGQVLAGDYHVKLHLLDESRTTYLYLEKKTDHLIELRQLSSLADNNARDYKLLACNMLNYRLYQEELVALICHWLTDLQQQITANTNLCEEYRLNNVLQTILKQGSSLSKLSHQIQTVLRNINGN